MRKLVLAFTLIASPAWAECPAAPDISEELDNLIVEIHAVESDMAAREVSARMWELWLRAPDETAQGLLDTGMRARAGFDFIRALSAFERLVAYCPAYAEGYNQRAFVYFLAEDYDKALTDLDRALELSPKHVGAGSGRALTLMNLGRIGEARVQLLSALEHNPWLSERFLLDAGGPLAPKAQDI
jgi:tetratricopeptide (TPR) repeat protein